MAINWQPIITSVVAYLTNFEFLALAIVIQKVVFLESHTRQHVRKFLAIIAVVTLLLLSVHVLMFMLPNKESYLGTVLFLLFCLGYMFVPLLYSAYTGRKKHKWLAFFEFIPIVGFVDGIWILLDLAKGMIPGQWSLYCYDLGMPLVVLSVLAILLWKRPHFVSFIIRDIRSRSLTVGEEIVVWIVGVWLFAYDFVIEDYLQTTTTELVITYVGVLNCVVAFIIIAFVINSNYRDFYHKKNLHLQKSLISAMAELVENRDENTGGHIQRTSRYVEIVARKLQKDEKYSQILTDKYIADMVIAAPLHDVGKIHIPDAILNKPGRLDSEEFATMKTHSAAGGAIIAHIESNTGEIEYLRIAREMAEYHHERMDGKGYPYGLSGEAIPLCARILAVADVFDAVSSKRCYKEAMSLDQSFAIIAEESGSHFDPDVAKAFLDSREEVECCFRETANDVI